MTLSSFLEDSEIVKVESYKKTRLS